MPNCPIKVLLTGQSSGAVLNLFNEPESELRKSSKATWVNSGVATFVVLGIEKQTPHFIITGFSRF